MEREIVFLGEYCLSKNILAHPSSSMSQQSLCRHNGLHRAGLDLMMIEHPRVIPRWKLNLCSISLKFARLGLWVLCSRRSIMIDPTALPSIRIWNAVKENMQVHHFSKITSCGSTCVMWYFWLTFNLPNGITFFVCGWLRTDFDLVHLERLNGGRMGMSATAEGKKASKDVPQRSAIIHPTISSPVNVNLRGSRRISITVNWHLRCVSSWCDII